MRTTLPQGHCSRAAVELLTEFAREAAGQEGLDAILLRVGLADGVDEWVDYGTFRALAEAIADALGGPAVLRHLASQERPYSTLDGIADSLSALTTPDAMLERLAAIQQHYETIVESRAERVRSGEWLVRTRYVDGFPPYRAHCGYARGVLGRIPRLYGLPAAEVDEEECQVDGAPWCVFRVRWDPAVTSGRPVPALESRILEARLEALQEAIGDLVSGESIDIVLTRVLHSVARTVLARGFVLSVQHPEQREQWMQWEALSEDEARRCASSVAGRYADPRWSVAEVRSGDTLHGHLIAIHGSSEAGRQEHVILDAYARVAASALDSATLIHRANEQAELASALLRMSRSLAEIGTSLEMAERMVHTVPSLVDCDQVVVSMVDGDGTPRVVAAHGYGPTIDPTIPGTEVAVDDGFMQAGSFRVLQRGMPLTANERHMLGRAAALATVPIAVADQVIGWVAAIVQERPERLLEQPGLDERLHGLAALAATAMYNARLVDQIRFQADHDPLTGLANQRLLEAHTTNAIARARRDRNEVALLFLDLNDFKYVNDQFGHGEGDHLLQTLARRVKAVLREGDTVARVGGDEFVVLLPSTTDRGAAVVAKIHEALAQPVALADRSVHVTTSIGVACFPADGADVDALLHRADMRMYDEKVADRQTRVSRT